MGTHTRSSISGTRGAFAQKPLMGLDVRKSCLRGVANNTGAEQATHPRSLISAFVIRFLIGIISRLATVEISTF